MRLTKTSLLLYYYFTNTLRGRQGLLVKLIGPNSTESNKQLGTIVIVCSVQCCMSLVPDPDILIPCAIRQPTAEHVHKLADQHRTAISILKKFAECLAKETEGWQSNIKALHKAQKDEATALKKAEEKAEQARQKELDKQALKQKREEQKRQAAEAKEKAAANIPIDMQQGFALGGPELGAKTKRRRTGGISSLSEHDPTVLREMPKFSAGSMVLADNIADFARRVCMYPEVACGTRLKTVPMKKVLET